MKNIQIISLLIVSCLFVFTLSCGDESESDDAARNVKPVDARVEENTVDSGKQDAQPVDSTTLLNRIASILSDAKTIRVKIETGYDVMQSIGQKLEFGDSREVYIERPENILIKIQDRQGDRHQFQYNGQMINYSSPDEKVYAEVELTGNIEDAVRYFTHDLQTNVPLSELFSVNLKDTIQQRVTSSAIVDRVYINGVETHHIAMRTEEVDAQIWADVNTDLPIKIILTYKNEPGQPQFWAVFTGWEIDQPVDSSNFLINNSDFQKIQFLPVNGG